MGTGCDWFNWDADARYIAAEILFYYLITHIKVSVRNLMKMKYWISLISSNTTSAWWIHLSILYRNKFWWNKTIQNPNLFGENRRTNRNGSWNYKWTNANEDHLEKSWHSGPHTAGALFQRFMIFAAAGVEGP